MPGNAGKIQAKSAARGQPKTEEAMGKKNSRGAPRAEYLGVEQAAALTSMSIWFWRRKAYNGVITSVKIGRRLLIPRTEIDRMVAENTKPRVDAAKVPE
jgi:excisionase family DNA binding protein